MTDEAPKSAYELAMERLRKKDKEEGVSERPLTDEQREAIAEARRVAEARLAEREILYQSAVRQDRRSGGRGHPGGGIPARPGADRLGPGREGRPDPRLTLFEPISFETR